MSKTVLGILAHVDAGKTTLSESILYLTGSIRKLGRVDNKDAFLDTYSLERERGITIFSKQAEIEMRGRSYTLLDTPGHVDFSAEMERTLQVLDYAVLVISGADGVQGHTQTLWRLLARYEVPTFIFVNKMDQNGTDRRALMEEIRQRLGDSCIDFSEEADARNENLAMCDEKVLEAYLEKGTVTDEQVRRMITGRKVFPCFFGSALKLTGVQELLAGIAKWTEEKQYPETFGARVFKIARDAQGGRLTYMKITGGSLKVKAQLRGPIRRRQEAGGEAEDTLSGKDASAGEWEEKVNQIRIYNGTKFETVDAASAGTVCAVTGLTQTQAGDGLGAEDEQVVPLLEPVLTYRVELPEGSDLHKVLHQLRQLEEEEPELHIVWDDISGQVLVQLMGEIQTEILQQMIHERFGLEVKFGTGQIVYKETIAAPVEGVGHFEPLRHYAEPFNGTFGGRQRTCLRYCLQREYAGSQLAASDPDTSGGKGSQRRIDGSADHGYAHHIDCGKSTSEAYRRRGFQAGDLQSGAPGTAESRKCSAGTLLPLQAGIAAASGRTCHDRY